MRLWAIAALCSVLGGPALAQAAEQTVSIPGGKAPLFGTLASPEGAPPAGPAVLILAGSGPTDRNGNSRLGPAPNELKQLADALSAAGLVSLRIDKRGIGASAAAAPPESDMRLSTYVDDAVAWAQWLRGQAGVRCVVLAGHSEGAVISLLAAEKAEACGVVLLAGPGRPLAEVLREQLRRQLQEPLLGQALAVVDELAAGRTVAGAPPELATLFRADAQPYLISEFSVDPAAVARASRRPLLLIQGDKDQQVALADFERLKSARPDATAIVVQGMIHPLKLAPAPGQPVDLTNLPLAPGVGEAVIRFIRGLPGAPARR